MEGCIILLIVIMSLLLVCKYLKYKQIEKFQVCEKDTIVLQGLTCEVIKKKCQNSADLGCGEFINKLECCIGNEANEGGMGGCDPTCVNALNNEPRGRDGGWYQ